jgi:hypothetical protein
MSAGLESNVVPLITRQWIAAAHQVQISTWPAGVHSLQAAIWLLLPAVQASTVIAAVCSNLVTKASQSVYYATLSFLFNECLPVA